MTEEDLADIEEKSPMPDSPCNDPKEYRSRTQKRSKRKRRKCKVIQRKNSDASLSSDHSDKSLDDTFVDPFIDYSWTTVEDSLGTVDALYSHLGQMELNGSVNVLGSTSNRANDSRIESQYSVTEALKSSNAKPVKIKPKHQNPVAPTSGVAGRSVFFNNMRSEKMKTKRFVEIISHNSPLNSALSPRNKLPVSDPYDFDGDYGSNDLDRQRGGRFHALFLRRRSSIR